MRETKRRARYTLELKLEALRLVKGGQVTAKILGTPSSRWRTGCAWMAKASSMGLETKPVTPEQMELAGYEMKSSISRKGNCWDNAPNERFWGRLKEGRL